MNNPKRTACPYCHNATCEADWVDIGVGEQQTGPFYCEVCGAVQIGPYDAETASDDEQLVGWYEGEKSNELKKLRLAKAVLPKHDNQTDS